MVLCCARATRQLRSDQKLSSSSKVTCKWSDPEDEKSLRSWSQNFVCRIHQLAIIHKKLSVQSKKLEQLYWPLRLMEKKKQQLRRNLSLWQLRGTKQMTWAIKPSIWMEVRSFCRQILKPASINQVLIEWYVYQFTSFYCFLNFIFNEDSLLPCHVLETSFSWHPEESEDTMVDCLIQNL